jgi:PhnB protein
MGGLGESDVTEAADGTPLAEAGQSRCASLTFGSTKIFLADDFSEGEGMRCAAPKALGGCTALYFFYVPDADAAFHRAVAAGAEVVSPLEDMFWGDRTGKVRDPFGHEWVFATPIKK